MHVSLHVLVQQHQKRKSKMVLLFKAEEYFDHIVSSEITRNLFTVVLDENFLSLQEKCGHSNS